MYISTTYLLPLKYTLQNSIFPFLVSSIHFYPLFSTCFHFFPLFSTFFQFAFHFKSDYFGHFFSISMIFLRFYGHNLNGLSQILSILFINLTYKSSYKAQTIILRLDHHIGHHMKHYINHHINHEPSKIHNSSYKTLYNP